MKNNLHLYERISNWFLSKSSIQIFALTFLGIPFYLWLFSIIYKLNNRNGIQRKGFNNFIFFISIYPIVYVFIFIIIGIYAAITESDNLFFFILPFHLIAMICSFLLLYYAGKSINQYQKAENVNYFDSTLTYILIYFYIVGIWLIQSKLNEILSKLNPEIKVYKNEIKVKTSPFLFERMIACWIDYSIIFILFYLTVITFGEKNEHGGYSGDYLGLALIGIWLFFAVFIETIFNSTIGNSILGLKVLNKSGTIIRIWQPFVRHLFDLIDMWPIGIVGICTIKFTPNNQRLGDLIANTIVVKRNQSTIDN